MLEPVNPVPRLRLGDGLLATIDHLDTRLSGRRGSTPGVERTVLACYDCNNRRNREEQKATPIELRRVRSQNGHRKTS